MNKYFKGKSLAKKIYLKEEQIAEIQYYLKGQAKDDTSTMESQRSIESQHSL